MIKTLYFSSILAILLIIGCAVQKPPVNTPPVKQPSVLLTREVIKKYKLLPRLNKIQFANGPTGQSILLKINPKKEMDTVVNGKLQKKTFEKVDSVLIRPFTKCKVVGFEDPDSTQIRVAFDGDSLFLVFGPDKKDPINGRYVLLCLRSKNEEKMTYYGKRKWNIITGYENAMLFFDIEEKPEIKREGKVAPGAIVGGNSIPNTNKAVVKPNSVLPKKEEPKQQNVNTY